MYGLPSFHSTHQLATAPIKTSILGVCGLHHTIWAQPCCGAAVPQKALWEASQHLPQHWSSWRGLPGDPSPWSARCTVRGRATTSLPPCPFRGGFVSKRMLLKDNPWLQESIRICILFLYAHGRKEGSWRKLWRPKYLAWCWKKATAMWQRAQGLQWWLSPKERSKRGTFTPLVCPRTAHTVCIQNPLSHTNISK